MTLQYGIIGPGAVGTTIAYELLRSLDTDQVHLFERKPGKYHTAKEIKENKVSCKHKHWRISTIH